VSANLYWRISSVYFTYFAFIGVFTTYFSLYLADLKLSPAEIGILMSLLNVMRIVMPNFWGWLSDHTGKRAPIIRTAYAISIVAFCGLFAGDSFWWLFAVIMLMCTFWSAFGPLTEASTMNHLSGDTSRYGRIRLWGSVGYIVAVTLGGLWLDHVPIGWLPWLVLGLMLITLGTTFTVAEKPVPPHEHDHVSIWHVVRRPAVMVFFLACFLMIASQGAAFVFYSIYMVEQGYSKTTVGLLWSVGVVAEVLIFMFLPRVFARFDFRTLWVISFSLTVVRYLIVGWFPSVLALQVLAQALHMFSFGTYHATALAVLHSTFKGKLQTRGQALYTSISFGAGGALGGMISGWTWTAWGPAWTFTISSALALAGLLLVLLRPDVLRREPRPA
jgi:MFS transporter, PPP family, 3-phenylpropionic acid transporter